MLANPVRRISTSSALIAAALLGITGLNVAPAGASPIDDDIAAGCGSAYARVPGTMRSVNSMESIGGFGTVALANAEDDQWCVLVRKTSGSHQGTPTLVGTGYKLFDADGEMVEHDFLELDEEDYLAMKFSAAQASAIEYVGFVEHTGGNMGKGLGYHTL